MSSDSISVGDAAVSVCGRDKTKIYAVVSAISEDRVLCTDGVKKKVKNPLHLRKIGECHNVCFDSEESVKAALSAYSSKEYAYLRRSYYKPKKG